jgi:hypothetical protein
MAGRNRSSYLASPLGWALLGLVACDAASPAGAQKNAPYPAPNTFQGGSLVAKIGPVNLTTDELERRIQAQTPFVRAQLRDLEQRKKFVETEVQGELLAQEAWRRGLAEDPRVVQELKSLMVRRLMNDELEKAGKGAVGEADVAAAYQARFDEFNKPETTRASQIVRYVDDAAGRKAAHALLEGVKAKVIAEQKKNNQNAFADLARAESQDEETKNGGGDLQFLSKAQLAERYGDDVAKKLFDDMQVGDLAVADAPNAVVLFKKTGKRRGIERSLGEVSAQLKGQLQGERRNAAFQSFVKELEKERGVTVDYDLIPKLSVNLDAPTGGPAADKPDAGQ